MLENKLGVMRTYQDTYGCNREIVIKSGNLRGVSFIYLKCGESVGGDIYYCKLCAKEINVRVFAQEYKNGHKINNPKK